MLMNLKNKTRLTVEVDHMGGRYVVLDVTNPDSRKKSIAYHYDNVRGKWICVRDGAPVTGSLSDLVDALISTHDVVLPAVEEDLHDREN